MDFLGPVNTCPVGVQLGSHGFVRALGVNTKLWEKPSWANGRLFLPKARGGSRGLQCCSLGWGRRPWLSGESFKSRAQICAASLARADTVAPGASTLDRCGLVSVELKLAMGDQTFLGPPPFLLPQLPSLSHLPACSAKCSDVSTARRNALRMPRVQIVA